MKKIIFLFAVLISTVVFSQDPGGPKANAVKFVGDMTTSVRDLWDVPTGEIWMIYNITTSRLEYAASNDVWIGIADVGSSNGAYFSTTVQNFIEVGTAGPIGGTDFVRISGGTTPNEVTVYITDNYAVLGNYSNADIDAAGDDSFITKRYFDANNLAGGEPSNGDKGDVTVTLGGLDWRLDPGSVASLEIEDGSIIDQDIQNATIDLDLLADTNSPSVGDVLGWSGSGSTFTWVPVGSSGTPDDDSVTPAKMADGDFGVFTVASNIATLDANVVGANEIDLTGAFSWTGAHTFSNQVQFGGLGTRYNNSNSNDYWTWATVVNESPSHVLQFYDEGVFTSQFKFPASGIPTDPEDVVDKAYADTKIGSDPSPPTGWERIEGLYYSDYDTNPSPAALPSGYKGIVDNSPPAETGTGTALNMSGYYQYNFGAASSATTFTMTSIKPGGYAESLINTATAPTVTGATPRPNGLAHIPNTDMVLHTKDYNGTRKYWFTEF